MIELNDLEWELADILVNTAINNTGKYTYKELSDELSKRLNKKINYHYGLSVPLGKVSILCYELGLPLLSARVIYTGATSSKQISDGFYNFACDYRPEFKEMNPNDAWKSELERIRKCSNWKLLRDYLDGKQIENNTTNQQLPKQNEDKQIQDQINEKLHLHQLYQESKATKPIFPDEIASFISEGAIKNITINVHERNPKARQTCIGYYGTRCFVCDIDLVEIYGSEFEGKIHVHHLNPIANTQEEHDINPIEEMRPVCPNCHMIIHCRENPPYTIEEVKQMIAKNKKN